jgi:ferritin-like metal-binding protein YciE
MQIMKTARLNKARPKQQRPAKKESTSRSDAFRALRGLFIDQLKDIYWSEKALLKSIPAMIKHSSSKELSAALAEHLVITRQHVQRLETIFSVIEEKAAAVKCDAMIGLISEARGVMSENAKGTFRDAGIIAAAKKVEHYEIATYGTLCSLARNLGEEDAAVMLYETLEEEREADEKLAGIAEDLLQDEKKAYLDFTKESNEEIALRVSKKKKRTK